VDDDDDPLIADPLTIGTRNMVAAGSLFLLCLSASSYHCRHGYSNDLRRHARPLFGVKSSSSSSALRREDRKKSFLSARSAGMEGNIIDDGVNISTLGVRRKLQWEQNYLLLKRFQEREGHCSVPQSHKEDRANLGKWVNTQRQLKKKETLDPERQTRLEKIGFEWGLDNVTWDEMYALLHQFKKREGHCSVPQSHKEDGANLGKWVNTQRQLKMKETLDPERQTRLEEIGFEWELAQATWDELYALLQQFKKREGYFKVPQTHIEDGANLGIWVSRQRHLKKKEKLDPYREKRLEDIGLEWGSAQATWDEMYALLKQFNKREGHCKVPVSHTADGENLGMWVHRQRQLNKKETVDPERQKRLEEIGFFEWGSAKATWDEMYTLLQQFKKPEGHCNVPQLHIEDGANLGEWVSRQRKLKRKEKLDPDRETRLEEIGFKWVIQAKAP
jgi:hypothetical protein